MGYTDGYGPRQDRIGKDPPLCDCAYHMDTAERGPLGPAPATVVLRCRPAGERDGE